MVLVLQSLNMLKKILIPVILFPFSVYSQDINTLQKEAINFERQFKESEALEKYKQITIADGGNINALVKCTELYCSIGSRKTDKNSSKLYYDTAMGFAKRAVIKNANNVDADYAMALVNGKFTEVETDKQKVIEYVKQTRIYANKVIALNPDYAKAYYVMGKWHYEIMTLSWFKKVAVKAFYGGLPPADMDSAIANFEKCKTLDQYFARNYLDLAKAYQHNNQPARAIEILNLLMKLPNRCYDDTAIKTEGKQLLDKLQ